MIIITNNINNDTRFDVLDMLNSETLPFYNLPWGTVITMTFIFFIAPYFNFLGVRFLKDQPLIKQCIMNQLCRDGAKLQTVYVAIWAIYVVGMKFIQAAENEHLFLEITKYVSFANEAMFFTGILILSLIAFLRLYTTVYQILDPFEDWFGVNENIALKIIRLIITFTVILIIGSLSLTSATPIVYYRLTEVDLKWNEISWQSRLKFVINIICCIVCAILFVAGNIYQCRKESRIQSGHHYQIHISESGGDEIRKGNEFVNIVSLNSVLYLFNFLLILAIILLLYLNIIHFDIWWGITTMIGIQGVIMPIICILSNKSYRHYCLREIRNDFNNCIRFYNAWTSAVKQHTAQVSTLQ